MEYTVESQASDLLTSLNEQRLAGKFCDVSIRCEDDIISAHRCVLAAASDYFRALFLSGFKDQSADEYTMPHGTPRAVRTVIDFMYCGKIPISQGTVDDILQVADFLCMKEVTNFCSDLLRRHLNFTNCVHVKALTDQYSLEDIREEVMDYLASRMTELLKASELLDIPFEVIYALLSDKALNYVKESHFLEFIVRWINRSPTDRKSYAQRLLELVEFSYLPSDYIKRNVATSQSVIDMLSRDQRRIIDTKMSDETYPKSKDSIIICRSRAAKYGDEVKLMAYIIDEDVWYGITECPEPHLLDDLESMASHQGALYLLLTRREDICGYMHKAKERKQLWKVSLDKGLWTQMPPPGNSSGQSRLVPHVRGLYVIDRTGVIEKYDNTTNTWVNYSSPGFTECPNSTLYLLPMPMDTYIYVLRGFSEGYAFNYAQMSYTLHRYDTNKYSWDFLCHIDADELDLEEDERFHGYTATPSSLVLKTALGFPRVKYDTITSTCSAIVPATTAPKFVSEIWGSVEHRDRVYFCGTMSQTMSALMLYDHGKSRFKTVSPPPMVISGLMCHVTAPRSFRESLTKC